MTKPSRAIEWPDERTSSENATSMLQHITSVCGQYRVTISKSKYGLPPRSYALLLDPRGIWELIKIREGFRHDDVSKRDCEQHLRALLKK